MNESVEINSYEKRIIEIMIDENCSFRESMRIDFDSNGVDVNSVFDLVDYLESKVKSLDSVAYLMGVYTGSNPDMKLKVEYRK